MAVKTGSSRRQPKRGCKAFWDAKQLDGDLRRGFRSRIATWPLLPEETRVRALCAGQDHVRRRWPGSGRQLTHLNLLVACELLASASMCSPAPVLPKQRSRTDL